MKLKNIITGILLVFVAISIVYLSIQELVDNPTEEMNLTETSTITAPYDNHLLIPETDTNSDTVIVYYFHGYYRCTQCLTIEAYTKDAVTSAFPDELKDGRLQLLVLNMQDEANKNYIQDFQLSYYMVVLEIWKDGKRQEWKKLEGVWDLLGNEDAFIKYIQDETRSYLKKI